MDHSKDVVSDPPGGRSANMEQIKRVMRCEKVMNVSQRWIAVKATGEQMPFRAAIPTPGPIYQGAINWEHGRKADEHKGAD